MTFKAQVGDGAATFFRLPGLPGTDAADALGLAITHAHAGAAASTSPPMAPLQRRQHAMYKSGRSY